MIKELAQKDTVCRVLSLFIVKQCIQFHHIASLTDVFWDWQP